MFGMEDRTLERIALLLQIITDELYFSRNEKDHEGEVLWESAGRDLMIRNIELMRNKADELAS